MENKKPPIKPINVPSPPERLINKIPSWKKFNFYANERITIFGKHYFSETMTREDFLRFFRDNDQLNQLSADDRLELFHTIMKDGSYITAELLNEIISDYSANIEIISKPHGRDDFMQFLRDASKLEQLTQEERTEVFRYALIGDSDFTVELFEELFEKYNINNLDIVDHSQDPYKVVVTYGEEQVKKMHDGISLTEEEKERFVKTYKFESAKEAEAFKEGLEAGDGWREYYIE